MKGLKWLNQHSRLLALASVLSLLLSFLLCFIQVKNASAVNYTVDLSFVKLISSGTNWHYYWKYHDESSTTESTNQIRLTRRYLDSDSHPDYSLDIVYFCSNNSYSVTKDHFYNVRIFSNLSETENVLGTITNWTSNTNFYIMDVRVIYQNTLDVDVLTSGRISNPSLSPTFQEDYVINTTTYPDQYVVYDVMLQARSTGSYQFCLGNSGTTSVYTLPKMTVDSQYTFRFFVTSQVLEFQYDTSSQDMNEKDDEDRQNIESQQSDSSDSSDDSQEEAESTGTTLLAAFSSFVTAITNASPSNCNLLMNMGNLNLGNVNLCQLSPPPAFQAIASIFMILFCVPLSIATARKVIDLFRSFQT